MALILGRREMLAGLGTALVAPAVACRPYEAAARLGLGLSLERPESLGLSSEGLAKIDLLMSDFIARNQIQGAVTAVARYGKLAHYRAHGWFDVNYRIPMPVDAIFRMMSSTKPVTGIAVLQQMELGRIGIDDPIGKFIPELAEMRVLRADAPQPPFGSFMFVQKPSDAQWLEPTRRQITVRDLLTHTSGLNGRLDRTEKDTLASYIPRLRELVLDHQPGTKWSYSGLTGPDVLARIVELTSGERYDRYLKRHIFDPVGMIDTAHNLTAPQQARIVHRVMRVKDTWVPANRNETFMLDGSLGMLPLAPGNTSYIDGSGGLKSTARDYIRLSTMLANRGTISGRRVLRPETVDLMASDLARGLFKGVFGSQTGYAFGALVASSLDPAATKSPRPPGAFGWGGAFGTESWADPTTGLAAVLMVQQPVGLQTEFDKVVTASLIRGAS